MNSNTCPSHVPGPQAHHRPTNTASVGPNKIYSNYSVKQTSSGSETDVSTSTENLTPEEHYVLKTGIRQEPQGEETYLDMSAASDGLPFSSTLMVHENGPLNNFNYMPPYLFGKIANNIYAEVKDQIPKSDNFFYHNHSFSEQPNPNAPTMGDKPELVKNNLVSVVDNDSHYSNLNLIKFAGQTTMPTNPLFIDNESVIKLQSTSEQNKIVGPDASINLQQPMLNNYLNSLSKKKDSVMIKNFNADNSSLPPAPPPQPADWNAFPINSNASKSCERLAISRSHPDLSKFGDEELQTVASSRGTTTCFPAVQQPYEYSQNSFNRNGTIELIMAENSSLRAHLKVLERQVKKMQHFDLEIQKVHQSHEELMKSSEKKENLERTLRYKLEIQVRKLQDENRCLKDQLESNANKRGNYDGDGIDVLELRKEINKREMFITRLMTQMKEYNNDKERQEIELQAQRLTLQEQRKHVEILDTALMTAQNNILILETELRKKHEFEEKTLFLKKALSNLRLANDRRLQMEKRFRTQLEKEIEELKKQNMSEVSNGETKHPDKDVDSTKLIREYEEKIISLELEVSKWEQKYLEESTLRSLEVSAASAPKDAKIAALERTSQESEKLIAEARNERLKHMDEIHLGKKKFTEIESKLRDVESKLAEKDAMIKVLQKHSEDRDAALQKTLRRFPSRHTRSASTMGLVVSGSATSSISPSPVNSPDSLSADLSKLLVSSTSQRTSNNLVLNSERANANNIDEQLREIDSRLSPKDSIIKALRNEKERYPNHYNNWRL